MGMSNTMMLRGNEPTPMIGKTDTKIFWIIMIVSLFIVAFVVEGISRGAIAFAANSPLPTTVTAKKLDGTNFKLYPGLLKTDGQTPVAINSMDAKIVNLDISKSFTLPIANTTVTLDITAGTDPNNPAVLNNMLTQTDQLNANSATFNNLTMFDKPGPAGLEQDADSVSMTNLTLQQKYLSASSVTLTGLNLSVTVK